MTVRRFGYADESQQAAQAHADERAREALERIVAGEKLPRRELKRAYAGTDGLPIREEIVDVHGNVVVTRNGYGARCLNVRDVLFVDVDFDMPPTSRAFAVIAVLCAAAGASFGVWIASVCTALGGALVAALASPLLTDAVWRMQIRLRGGAEAIAHRRISLFSRTHPDWHLRVYRTTAGLRVLAMHRTFEPHEAATTECFDALGADQDYARMCRMQNCFRARLTPKPWRIGLQSLATVTRAVWPVKPELLEPRARWVERYELAARGYAACAFIEALGTSKVHDTAEHVRVLHDEVCRATQTLPLA